MRVVGEGADHSTRGRVRSPVGLNRYGLEGSGIPHQFFVVDIQKLRGRCLSVEMKRILIIGGLCLVILGIILIRSSRTKSVYSSGQLAISSNGTLTVQPQNDRATFTVVADLPRSNSAAGDGGTKAGAK